MIGSIGNVYIAAKVAQKAGSSLRGDVFKRVLGFGNQEIDGFSTSSLITRTTNDVLQIQNVVLMFLRMMLMSPLMIIGASIMAYQNEKRLTMVFLGSVPLLAIAIGIIMRFSVPLFKSLQGKIDRINLTFREGLTGVRVIRAFRQDKFEQDRFKEANKDYTETGIKVFSIVSLMFPIMNLILNGTNMTIVWFGAKLIGDKTMEVGNLVSFMTYANMILFSFMMLSMVFVFIPRAQAAAERLNEVLDTKYTITDPDAPERFTADAPSELEFDNVDFYYEGAEKPALIPRLYDATDGTVKVNGKDVKKVAQKDLHDKISFVQQKAVLFKGTIRSNMLFGNPNATDEDIWHALEIAQSKDFVSELEDGLDSVVEQGGGNFSGGQRQRLAIARALMKKASVYVFDDSFSALDFKTDAKLRQALQQDPEIKNSVVVIVAQRVSTVLSADVIIVLDGGEVVGKGTHEELLKTNETYREIVNSQIRKGDM